MGWFGGTQHYLFSTDSYGQEAATEQRVTDNNLPMSRSRVNQVGRRRGNATRVPPTNSHPLETGEIGPQAADRPGGNRLARQFVGLRCHLVHIGGNLSSHHASHPVHGTNQHSQEERIGPDIFTVSH